MKISHDIKRQSSLSRNLHRWWHQRSTLGYFWNRIEWHWFPRFFHHKEYPIHVDIETTSHCQMHCPMCFREHRAVQNEGKMSFDLYKKIIDEIEGKVYSIKFTGRGETLIHKEFPKFMAHLKGKKFGEIGMITNGQFMTDEVMHSIIDNGMDFVSFSVDGVKENYDAIRKPMTYEKIIEIVTRLHRLRAEKGSAKPLIRISAVDKYVEGNEKEFLETWTPISDDILFLFFKDYSAHGDSAPQSKGSPCPFIYQRMFIHWNGTIPMCGNDEYEEAVRGSLERQTVREVWLGHLYAKARELHEEGRRDVFICCARCPLYREGHGKETPAAKVFGAAHRIFVKRRKPAPKKKSLAR